MIAIIDYDAGNLKSVEKALISLGEEVQEIQVKSYRLIRLFFRELVHLVMQ